MKKDKTISIKAKLLGTIIPVVIVIVVVLVVVRTKFQQVLLKIMQQTC